jgi:hypothetical protein
MSSGWNTSYCAKSEYRIFGYEDYMRARREYVSFLAHRHWLQRGCAEGSAEADWYLAEMQADLELIGQLDLGLPA